MNKLTNYEFCQMVEKNLNTKLSNKIDVKVIKSIYNLLKKANNIQELLVIKALINKYVNYASCKDFCKTINIEEEVSEKDVIMTCGEIKVCVINALENLGKDLSPAVKDACWTILRREVKDLLSTPEYTEIR